MPQIPLIALEILIGFGVPIAWGVWQLISLRRERLQDAARERAQRDGNDTNPGESPMA